MFSDKIEASIDIGAKSVKGVTLKKGTYDKIDSIELPHGAVINGNIEDTFVVSDAIKALSEKLGMKNKKIVVSLPVQSFTVKFLEIPRTLGGDVGPFIENELEDIVPGFSPDNFITDHVLLDDKGTKSKYMAMTIQKDKVATVLAILSALKLKPVKIIPDFVALFNILELTKLEFIEESEKKHIMVIDMGAEATKIFVSLNGVVKMHRIAPVGGNDLTEIVGRAMKKEFDEAEEIKKNLELKDEKSGEDKEEVFEDLSDMVEELNAQIKRSIDLYKAQEGILDIDEVILTGGGSMMKGFKEVLEKKIRIAIKEFPSHKTILKHFTNRDDIELNMRRYETLIGNVITEVAK